MASLGRAQLWLQVMAAWWWTGPVAASCTWRGPPLRAGPARAAEVARAQARERGADPAATPARPAAVAIAKVCCAGYLGGLAKYSLVQPLDTMTTVFEVSRAGQGAKGLIGAVKDRVAAKGVPSLFSGLKSTAIFALPYAIVFHTAQTISADWCKNVFDARDRRKGVSPSQSPAKWSAISGMWGSTVGSIAASCVGVPMEGLKHRAQVVGRGRARDLLTELVHLEGVAGLYSGFKATLCRNMLYNVAQWSTFPIALAVLTTSGVERGDGGAAGAKGAGGTSPQNPSLAAELGAGFIAGVCTAVATQPLDTVNTRLQTQTLLTAGRTSLTSKSGVSPPVLYRGVRHAAIKIVSSEGFAALYGGILPRCLNFGVGSAIFFLVFKRSLLALDTWGGEVR